MRIMPLWRLKPGQQGVVRQVDCGPELQARLEDLGLTMGLVIKCLHQAPSGSPTAYEIRGAAIALRRADAGEILVEVAEA